jgi:acetyltransferase-like isoleucine patch superfamily enzyme
MRYAAPMADSEVPVRYHQFTQGPALRAAWRAAGVATWPLVLPMAALARLSDFVFRTFSELLALLPYVVGVVARAEFYRLTLRRCGRNVSIGFGTVFVYRDVSIGENVLIGSYNTIHHCDFGDYVLVADGCRLLSGARYHSFYRTDVPMALQGGLLRRIRIERDCWIGASAVVMADVGEGSVVAAGAVVHRPVEPWSVVAGNPARVVRRRKEQA